MAITSITRDWGTTLPNIVRVVTTDSLATVMTPGYVTAQAANINAVNVGVWEWLPSDIIAIAASNGSDLFNFFGGDLTTFTTIAGPFVGGVSTAWVGGSTSHAFTAAGITSATAVVASIVSLTNAASIVTVVPGDGIITVTFSANPGANTVISYFGVK